jgi:hypothetical protein
VPIADEWIDSLGRRFNSSGALDLECVGLARGKGEQGHNENNDYDGNCHQHLTIPHTMLRSDDSKTGNRGIDVTAKGQKRVSRARPTAPIGGRSFGEHEVSMSRSP